MLLKRPLVKLDVVLGPNLLPGTDLKGARTAAVDVLRATTTIVTALASGADKVFPFMSSEDIRKYVASRSRKEFLLGGEEQGLKIPGFDLGNSPLEYLRADVVEGKSILFSTTNGTPTMRKAYEGSGFPVYISSLVNVSAVAEALFKEIMDGAVKIVFICSGKNGKPSAEDTFGAGLVAVKLNEKLQSAGIDLELSDPALIASAFAARNESRGFQVLKECEHGRYLQEINFIKDLEFASHIDFYDIAPVFNGEYIV